MKDIAPVLYAIIPIIVIFIVVYNIFGTTNKVRKGLWLLLTGLGVALLCFLGILFDLYQDNPLVKERLYYLPFGLLVLSLVLAGIILMIKGKASHSHFQTSEKIKGKGVSQYLYIVYKYEGMYYVKKEKDDSYSGCAYKFNSSINFYDDMLELVLKDNHISSFDQSLIGTATTYARNKKTVFYCFIVECNSISGLEGLEKLNPFEIASVKMSDFAKTLVMKMLIGESFNIEL